MGECHNSESFNGARPIESGAMPEMLAFDAACLESSPRSALRCRCLAYILEYPGPKDRDPRSGWGCAGLPAGTAPPVTEFPEFVGSHGIEP